MKRTLPASLVLSLLAATSAAQQPLYDHFGAAPGDQMAQSAAPLGDVNGDGHDDYAVGAPYADGQQPDSGVVYVRSGHNASTLWTYGGERTGDQLGWSVAALGDIDADGVCDLIVGAPRSEPFLLGIDRGGVYLLSGATGALLWKLGGTADFDGSGYAVSGTGDVDGDTVPDYAFSAPYDDLIGAVDLGSVWIYSGASHSFLRLLVGEAGGDQFGFALDHAGDVNFDLRGDLLVGAPTHDPSTGLDAGKAYLFSGIDGALLFSQAGAASGDNLGWAVAGGIDVNGDPRPELCIGAPYADTPLADAGQVVVRTAAAPYPQLYTIEGAKAGDQFGYALDMARDADGDGLGDVLVGAPGFDLDAVHLDAGRAYLFNGAAGALRYEIGGRDPGDRMGTAVSTVGLVNADGWTDFMGGAPFADHLALGTDVGWARVHLGNAQLPVPYCTPKTNSAGCVPVISWGGCPSMSVGNFTLVAYNVLENKPGILIWSMSKKQTPFYGGTLCLKAPIKRTPVQTSFVQTSFPQPCIGAYNFTFDHNYMSSKGISAGDDVFAQYWSRDGGFAPPNSVGLTGGLHVTVLP
jgi:hypothetical protein